MSKFFASILLVMFVISILWLYPMLPGQMPNGFANFGEPSSYSSKLSIIISFGAGMLTVYLSMLNVSRITQSKYKRFQKGIDGIFLIVMMVLSFIYAGIIVNGLNVSFNMLPLVPICAGLTLIVTGNQVQRFKADDQTATPLINAHNDLWNKVRHFVAKGLFAGGLLMLPCVFFPAKIILTIFLTILALLIATLLLGSYQIYKKHYIDISN